MGNKASKTALQAMDDALEKSRKEAVRSPLTPPRVKESLKKPVTTKG